MKRLVLLPFFALFAVSTTCYAGLTSVSYYDDHDGALFCNSSTSIWSDTKLNDTVTLTMDGVQNWTPGHMIAHLTASDPDDPSIISHVIVDNNTSLPWYGYVVNLKMNVFYTIGSVVAYTPGWTVGPVSAPTLVGSDWISQVTYSANTPADWVPVGGELEFSYKVTFSGATTYEFVQELTPQLVPEPGAFSLLAVGLGAVLLRRRN